MKSELAIVLMLVALVSVAQAEFQPGQTLRFEFPELPDTLASMHTGQRQPAMLTALLPDDYSTDKQFPLLVFLGGGDGGRGTQAMLARRVAGDTGFICVNMPLFRERLDRSEPMRGMIVSLDDSEVIQNAFRVMLKKLFDSVPNIRTQGNVLGGFSNGAHTVGVLLASNDPLVLEHFDHFFLIEGGMGPLLANVLHKSRYRDCRILTLHGDQRSRDGAPPYFAAMATSLQQMARRYQPATSVPSCQVFPVLSFQWLANRAGQPQSRLVGPLPTGDDCRVVQGRLRCATGPLCIVAADPASWEPGRRTRQDRVAHIIAKTPGSDRAIIAPSDPGGKPASCVLFYSDRLCSSSA